MLKIFFMFVSFVYMTIVFAQSDRFYYTKKGDSLDRILEDYVDLVMEESDRNTQLNIVKKNNPHIQIWKKMQPGQRIDMLGIEKRLVRVIDIEESSGMYIDQALWRGSLWTSYTDSTYTNKIQELEVQAASSSYTNFGINFEYSFSKSMEHLRYRGGYERNAFLYYVHVGFFLEIKYEEFWENLSPYMTFQTRDLHFNTLSNSLARDLAERTYRFIGLGNSLRYYIFENLTYFKFEASYLVQSTGQTALDENGFKLYAENEFVLHPNWSIAPYMEYMSVRSQQPVSFVLFGLKLVLHFDIL